MKHRTLHLAANLLAVLAAVYLVAGVVVSVIVGLGAVSIAAKIGFVVGGFILSAISAIMLLTVSRLITLFISVDDHLAQLVEAAKPRTGD